MDLAGLARDLVAFQSEEARRLEVSVQLRAPTSLEAMLDPDQVRQALLNLLRNAVEAAGPSGHVDVEVTRDPSGAHLRCVVADDGPGVAPEDTDRIFTPFFSNKKGGTGLGLAVAQRVAELHGGRLQVESLPDGRRGARFVLELPATRQ